MIDAAEHRADVGGPRGFTLLELLVVMVVIALVSGLAVARYGNSLQRYRADSAARRVVADLALAGAAARQASQSKTVVFDTSAKTLTISGVPDMDHPASNYAVALGDAPYYVAHVSASFGGASQVAFDGYGVPAADGTIIIQVGDVQKTILLRRDTGRAEIQ